MYWDSDYPVVLSQRLFCIRTKPELINPKYLYVYMNSYDFQEQIKNRATGSSVPGLRQTEVLKLTVKKLPLNVQVYIGEFTYKVNKKIELNRQINQTLEAMAQTLFKSWFVDFDPVKAKIAAKAEGADAAGITLAAMEAISRQNAEALTKMAQTEPERYAELKATAELFPDGLVESELGEIPAGWDIMPLDKIAHYQNGLALQKFRPENENEFLPVVKIAQLKKGVSDGSEKASPNIKPECIIDSGDVIFSWSGSLVVDLWCGGKAALNQHLFKVTSDKYPKWFYYLWTKHHLNKFIQIAASKAVTMGHIKRSHLKEALCCVPSEDIIEKIGVNFSPLNEQSIGLRVQSFNLSVIRNTLLPKLLSGEVSVENV